MALVSITTASIKQGQPKRPLLTLPPPTKLPARLHLKILMSEGDYGLHIWSGLGNDPDRTLQERLFTHPLKKGVVAPKPTDSTCMTANMSVVWHWSPNMKEHLTLKSYLVAFHFWKVKRLQEKFFFLKKWGWQSKALYSLHITLAPFGPVVPTVARLVLTEHYWYPQTCKKILSAWHVIWRSRCQLTKAAYACMETKAPKWHPATPHAVHQSRKYLAQAGCCCLDLFVNLLMHQ